MPDSYNTSELHYILQRVAFADKDIDTTLRLHIILFMQYIYNNIHHSISTQSNTQLVQLLPPNHAFIFDELNNSRMYFIS